MVTDPSVLEGDSSSDSSVASTILRRARDGDQSAFQRLVTLYAGLVYHWCRRAGLTPEDAEDVGQQVFLSVSCGLTGFRRDETNGSFRGWLRTITRTRLLDHFQEYRQRELAAGGDVSWNEPTITYHDRELPEDEEPSEKKMVYEQALALVRGVFSEQDFQAFHQVVLEGASPREVAAELGVSVNSIYIAKSRILKRLRDEFGDLLGGDPIDTLHGHQ